MIPYSKQNISENDVKEVVRILNSDFLTQGPQTPLFEKAVSKYCNVNYATVVNSATSALHIACKALGLKKGDVLWTSPNSYVSSANCALFCNAEVDFVDINPLTYNLCPDSLEKKLSKAKKSNRIPKIVIPVHFAGQSCDMKKIRELADHYNFKIIEDASHAIGGKYLNKKIGACDFSDITVFSFHAIKIITTGEGGLATTNNLDLFTKMQLFRNHGVTRNIDLMTKRQEGKWYYEQIDLGYNYRITEFQAALGMSQLRKINESIKKRHILKKRYDNLLKNLPIIVPFQSKDNYSSLHLYPIQIKRNLSNVSRLKLFNQLIEAGIGVNVHYIPIHTQPHYKKMGFKDGDFPISEAYYKNAISLPIFPNMSLQDQDKVVDVLIKAFQ